MWSRNVNNAVKAMQRTHSLRRPLNEHKPSLPTISQSSNTVRIVVSWSVELAPALIPHNLCRRKCRETHFKKTVWSNIDYKTLIYNQFFPELTLTTNVVQHGIMEEFWGGAEVARLFLPESERLVIRPFQERGNNWGLLGGLFTWIFLSERLFMTQSQTLWSHCTWTGIKKQRTGLELNGAFMT